MTVSPSRHMVTSGLMEAMARATVAAGPRKELGV